MSNRLSGTTIAGHALSLTERNALDAVRDYLLKNASDSQASNSTSPAGDGREIPLLEIFPRSNQGTASRCCIERLDRFGVLKACEIGLNGGAVHFRPLTLKPCYCGGGGMEHDAQNAACPRNVASLK